MSTAAAVSICSWDVFLLQFIPLGYGHNNAIRVTMGDNLLLYSRLLRTIFIGDCDVHCWCQVRETRHRNKELSFSPHLPWQRQGRQEAGLREAGAKTNTADMD